MLLVLGCSKEKAASRAGGWLVRGLVVVVSKLVSKTTGSEGTLEMRLRSIASKAWAALDPIKPDTNGVFKNYRPHELKAMDRRYRQMFAIHEDVHTAVLDDISKDGCHTFSEVACGAGYTVGPAVARGLAYTGIDISETAIAVSCLKEPNGDFINLPVDRLSIIKDRSFDAVYSSSMLEHIGFVETAIAAMWRLAAKRLDILFFEGLTDAAENEINFYPHEEGVSPREAGGYYGVKVARQDQGTGHSGYFFSKFSKTAMVRMLQSLDGHPQVTLRDFVSKDSSRKTTVATVRR